jgi:hypothetical protein
MCEPNAGRRAAGAACWHVHPPSSRRRRFAEVPRNAQAATNSAPRTKRRPAASRAPDPRIDLVLDMPIRK